MVRMRVPHAHTTQMFYGYPPCVLRLSQCIVEHIYLKALFYSPRTRGRSSLSTFHWFNRNNPKRTPYSRTIFASGQLEKELRLKSINLMDGYTFKPPCWFSHAILASGIQHNRSFFKGIFLLDELDRLLGKALPKSYSSPRQTYTPSHAHLLLVLTLN